MIDGCDDCGVTGGGDGCGLAQSSAMVALASVSCVCRTVFRLASSRYFDCQKIFWALRRGVFWFNDFADV